MMGAWNNNFIPGKIRTFLFKFYNNILGLNPELLNLIEQPTLAAHFAHLQIVDQLRGKLLHIYFFIVKPQAGFLQNSLIVFSQ